MFEPLGRIVGGVVAELFGTARPTRKGDAVKHARPSLEAMEGRLTPSGFNNWLNLSGDGLWSTNNNWSKGRPPTSTEVAVFDNDFGSYGNTPRSYSGSGGTIAKGIKIQPGYTSTVSLSSTGPIDLYSLEQNDGNIKQTTVASEVHVDNWEWVDGDCNFGGDASKVKVKANGSFTWSAARKVGSNVVLDLGGSGRIQLPNLTSKVEFTGSAGIVNYGSITHSKGEIYVDDFEDHLGYIKNEGSWTARDNTTQVLLAFENTSSDARLTINGVFAQFNSAGTREAPMKQTAGTIELRNGAKLSVWDTRAAKRFLKMTGGELTTGDNTLCKVDVEDARVSGGTISADKGDGGDGRLDFTKKLTLSGTANILIRTRYVSPTTVYCDMISAREMTIGGTGQTTTLTVQAMNYPADFDGTLDLLALRVTGPGASIQGNFSSIAAADEIESWTMPPYANEFRLFAVED